MAGIQRFTRRYPCLICGGGNDDPRGQEKRCTGFLSDTGKLAYCSRENYAGQLELNAKLDPPAYPHQLKGDCACGTVHSPGPVTRRQIEAVYDYEAADGTVLYQVVRTWPKDFYQRKPNGKGGFLFKLGEVERVPYHLPELLATSAKGILVVEGEQAVEYLRARGLLATCAAGGAGKVGSAKKAWTPEVARWLAGRQVVVIPDNDTAGREGASQAAQALSMAGARVRVLSLVGTEERAGADDWMALGHDVEELRALIAEAPVYEWHPPSSNGHGPQPPTPAVDGEVPFPDRQLLFTDTRNAERLVALAGDDLRFDFDRGLWRMYRDGVWALDDLDEILLVAKRAVLGMHEELRNASFEDEEQRRKVLAKILAVESTGRLRAMCENARSERPANAALWDADPMLLNCRNGTVDLRSGELRAHVQADMLTKQCPTEYDQGADCPRFLAFLTEIMAGDDTLVAFLQRAFGLALIGAVREHVFFVFWGHGGNGKSITLATIQGILGEYARATAHDFLLHHDTPQHLEGLAMLRGVRLVTTIETDENAKLGESLIKALTGDDRITARYLYQPSFEYDPSGTFFLATNHKPTIRDPSNAMWRRVKLIPFTVTISPPPGQVERLLEEAPGILAWMVRGCLEWQARSAGGESGLGSCAAVDAATREYRAEMDTLAAFFSDRCELGAELMVSSADLYGAFEEWSKKSGEFTWSKRFLGTRLRDRADISLGTDKCWHGVGLRGLVPVASGGSYRQARQESMYQDSDAY